MRARKIRNLVAITATLGCLASMVAGCVGLAVGAGAAGGTMAVQERGLKGGIDDAGIRLAINELWFTHDEAMYRKITLSISEKADDTGTLYGSVGAAAIVKLLAKAGVESEEKDIRLEEPIKSIGAHEIPIHVWGEHYAGIQIVVEPEA